MHFCTLRVLALEDPQLLAQQQDLEVFIMVGLVSHGAEVEQE
jgi:hypothetical protein